MHQNHMADVQRTLVLLKPDALQRDLLGEILTRFERKGLKIIGLKLFQLSDEQLNVHYAHLAEKSFFTDLKNFMKHTPVVGIVLEGMEAVSEVRKMIGSTNPLQADAGTVRADFSMNVSSNLVHASDSLENAAAEVERFFKAEELFAYEKITDKYIFG